MKIKWRRNKQADEMIVAYETSLEVKTSRYRLLKKIIENEPIITLIIDTNQRVGKPSVESAERYLKQADIECISIPVRANPLSFFGLGLHIKRRPDEEKILVMEISGAQFSRELFGVFENYDIALGLGRQKSLPDICEHLRVSGVNILFDKDFFIEGIYDSIVCSSVRSTANIEKLAEAAADEMAL
jgi:hypothetical protein